MTLSGFSIWSNTKLPDTSVCAPWNCQGETIQTYIITFPHVQRYVNRNANVFVNEYSFEFVSYIIIKARLQLLYCNFMPSSVIKKSLLSCELQITTSASFDRGVMCNSRPLAPNNVVRSRGMGEGALATLKCTEMLNTKGAYFERNVTLWKGLHFRHFTQCQTGPGDWGIYNVSGHPKMQVRAPVLHAVVQCRIHAVICRQNTKCFAHPSSSFCDFSRCEMRVKQHEKHKKQAKFGNSSQRRPKILPNLTCFLRFSYCT